MQQRSVKILSTGKYLPKRKVTAQELAEKIGVSSQWIEKKSGVKVRHFVADETTSQMGAYAAKEALAAAHLSSQDIDCIVCANTVPEQGIPCTAVLIQRLLGIADSGIPAFDINATCLSFVTALDLLSYLIDSGRYSRVLIVSSEIATIALDWSDHESCTLFGDGAAAVIVEKSPASDASAILASRLETYSEGADLSQCLGGGNKHHPREYATHPDRFVFQMKGRSVYRMASQILPGFLQRLFEPVGLSMADMQLVIPHQASLMSMRLIQKQLEIPEEAWMVIAHNHGNTMAASIPMALHEAIQQGRLNRGDRALLLGTAAGLSVGGMVLKY
ncbi:MAG TPA: beta-ketoacyl-ACP synthase III [Coleofasciculaceae cyanobacterium]|jgi:3-oxoacyl-[acyl-carrier-protein] synthase-3